MAKVNAHTFLVLAGLSLFLVACGAPSGGTTDSPSAAELTPEEEAATAEGEESATAKGEGPAAEAAEEPVEESLVDDAVTLEVIAKLNHWRLVQGLWPFQPNEDLAALALQQAEYVNSLPSFPDDVHAGREGEGPKDRARDAGWPHYSKPDQIAIAEIAYVGESADAAINWWQGSPVHRGSVTDPAYREIGAAALEHPLGYLFVVVLGARPDVLPALVDPETGLLYLSTELYRWAPGGDWIQTATRVQVLDSPGDELDEYAWLPWANYLAAPESGGQPFYVVYSDGTHQVTTEVRPGVDVAWLPSNLPSAESD